jgi:branched-chain amino acid transport system ATP-binding protein
MLNQFPLAAPRKTAQRRCRVTSKQWLEIVMAVAGKPRFLLLDEPTGGMSLAERRTKGEFLRRSSARTVMSRNPKLLLLDEPTASGSG